MFEDPTMFPKAMMALWGVGAFIVAMMASNKGYNFFVFLFFGMVLSPVLAGIVYAFLKPKPTSPMGMAVIDRKLEELQQDAIPKQEDISPEKEEGGTEGKNSSNGKLVTSYTFQDNIGTSHKTYQTADASWHTQGMTINQEIPFICYYFNDGEKAKNSFSKLSFIKKASDTGEFICLETLEFGCYETDIQDMWEVIIWGKAFTLDMLNETDHVLKAGGGNRKGKRLPLEGTEAEDEGHSDGTSNVSFKETTKKDGRVYEVYTGGAKSDAMAFLKGQNVNKSLHFVVVETPEGNWGKDKLGVYQE